MTNHFSDSEHYDGFEENEDIYQTSGKCETNNSQTADEQIAVIVDHLHFEQVGEFKFLRRSHHNETRFLVFARRDSGLIITVDTWQWENADGTPSQPERANMIWLHGSVPSDLAYGNDLGNNDPVTVLQVEGETRPLELRSFHKDVREGLVQSYNRLHPFASDHWYNGRDSYWAFIPQDWAFDKAQEELGPPGGTNAITAEHFRIVERLSEEFERTLPDWVQAIIGTEEYHANRRR
jgi:hypothetical protein